MQNLDQLLFEQQAGGGKNASSPVFAPAVAFVGANYGLKAVGLGGGVGIEDRARHRWPNFGHVGVFVPEKGVAARRNVVVGSGLKQAAPLPQVMQQPQQKLPHLVGGCFPQGLDFVGELEVEGRHRLIEGRRGEVGGTDTAAL